MISNCHTGAWHNSTTKSTSLIFATFFCFLETKTNDFDSTMTEGCWRGEDQEGGLSGRSRRRAERGARPRSLAEGQAYLRGGAGREGATVRPNR